MYKKYYFLTFLILSCFLQSPLESAADNQNRESKQEAPDQNWQQLFLESPDHNPLMSIEIRQKLIDKGYKIIKTLVNQETFENEIEIFQNAGRNFVEEGWLQQVPTLKSIKNTFSKGLGWASSFFYEEEKDYAQSQEELTLERRAHLESIIAIAWALADHGARLKYCQPNFACTIKDENNSLWDAIVFYVQRCKQNTQGYDSYFAYAAQELSEPFHDQKKNLEAWTIDIRFESTSWALPLLPYKNNTITFIKLLDSDKNAEKIGCYFRYKNEGISAWIPTFTNKTIHNHQETRKNSLNFYATVMREFIILEGLHTNDDALNIYEEHIQKIIKEGIHSIHDKKQSIPVGKLAYCAAYILNTNEYSQKCKEAARNLLFFLQNSCGDPIIETENKFTLKPLVLYRIFDEVVLDLAQLPLDQKPTIEILETMPEEKEISIETETKDSEPISTELVKKLFNALEKKKVEKVTQLITENPTLINTVNKIDIRSDMHGRTPLHHAVFKHNLELVKLLVQKGAYLEAKDTIGRTPLYMAYLLTKEPIMKFLIKSGSHINICAQNGDSVVHTALRRVDYQNLKYFLEHGGSLDHNKDQTIRAFNQIIQTAQIKPNKDALPHDQERYKDHIQVLTMPQVQDFLKEHSESLQPKFRSFLKELYEKKEKIKK